MKSLEEVNSFIRKKFYQLSFCSRLETNLIKYEHGLGSSCKILLVQNIANFSFVKQEVKLFSLSTKSKVVLAEHLQ